MELAIPKLRLGSYFLDWLLERRRRAEQALISVLATRYLLGVSTRRVDKLVEQLGIKHISKSQVSQMAKILDEQVEAFRTRALDAGPYTFLGLEVTTGEDSAGRLSFLRGLVARGQSGVHLVISDCHRGLVSAIGAVLAGASWQRCRTHHLRNLLSPA